jgi:hypothetical protein
MILKPDFRRKGWEAVNPNRPRFWFSLLPFRESGDGDKDWGLPDDG